MQPMHIGHRDGVAKVLGPHRGTILEMASRRGFDHVRVFGSVRRGEATKNSDIDLLVHARPHVSAFARAGLVEDLQDLLGRKVDVVEDEGIHWFVRPQVMFEAVSL